MTQATRSHHQPILIGGTLAHPTRPKKPLGPEELGFKAYNLSRMAALGLPVPPAFVLPTSWCNDLTHLKPNVWAEALAQLEQQTGQRLGDIRRPLLLSVRSGAPISMPGMMETLLNIGLCDATVPGLLRQTGNPRMVWDAYRRLVAGFGEVVLQIDPALFEADLAQIAANTDERALDFMELRALTKAHLATVQRVTGQAFPQDPHQQLETAIHAVFSSWNAPKAQEYRHLKQLDDRMGTAVTVQRMVFGNAGGTSGAGVGFTRHPSTGEPHPWVDFLFNAQGEDVVSGRRSAQGHEELASVAPRVWHELLHATQQLETAFKDMQDFEFTVENNRLFLLQTRNGKRTTQAAARIALDLADEGIITPAEALQRTEGFDEASLSITRVVNSTGTQALQPLAQAISAAHGVAIGEIVLDESQAQTEHAQGKSLILVRPEAETRDIVALDLAQGLLTARGARTSHAAVVARQLGKVCLVGCESLQVDLNRRVIQLGGLELAEGEVITLDGHSGAIYQGAVHTCVEVPHELLARLTQLRHAHPVE